MVSKTIKFDDNVARDITLLVKRLNEEAGVNLYDFSKIVRIAVKQYLDSGDILEIHSQENDST